ncbi:MAG TPA: alginate export family protein [Pseudomonadales bacterium]|nr:alginate export family protein [Pseudomonadales bacterium]
MKSNANFHFCISLAAICIVSTTPAQAEENIYKSLTSGKVTVNERLRFERVEDDAFAKDADALTLRSKLGYETAPYYGFTLLTEFENVHSVAGLNNYQLPAPPTPPATGYAVIADPEGSDFNRFQLRYRGISKLNLTLGRQYLTFDNQRWIGNVGFRQNDQTFDAFSATYTGIDDFTFNYAYVGRVHGITPAFDSNTSDNLFNVSYNGFTWGKFTAYSYDLKNQNDTLRLPAAQIDLNPGLRYITNNSTGLRFEGSYNLPTTVPLRALYRAEYANQSAEIMATPTVEKRYHADYKLGEIGMTWGFGGGNYALTPMLGYEFLGSDGGQYGLQTPYATKHAFNGWADQFLVTPKEGLVDQYATLGLDFNAYAIKTMLQYHEYSSASRNLTTHDGLDFGTETSLQVVKTFGPKWTIGTKFAVYDQADSRADVAVSGKKDLSKAWVWAEYNF